jgi:hypothetical protein
MAKSEVLNIIDAKLEKAYNGLVDVDNNAVLKKGTPGIVGMAISQAIREIKESRDIIKKN